MESKNGLKNFIYIFLISIYAVVYLLFIATKAPNYASLISMFVIIILAASAFLVYKFPKNEKTPIKNKLIWMSFIGIIVYFTIIYSVGLVAGYNRTIYSSNILKILLHILIPFISVVGIELFRYMYVRSNYTSKISLVLGTIFITLLDCVLAYYLVDKTAYGYFIFGTTVILPIIFKNIFLSYFSLKSGYESCLIFALPLALYGYIVPVVPTLGDYLTSIINVTFPSIMIIYASRLITDDLIDQEIKRLSQSIEMADKEEMEYKKRNKKFNIFKIFLIDLPIYEFIIVLVVLVSGLFVFHMLGVDTSAISDVAQRGDAVIIYKAYEQNDYNVNDVVIYKENNKYIIDRISRKQEEGNNKAALYVKTEIDQDKNINYKNISDNIIGVYVGVKIPKIAYPTIWFRDYLNGGKNEK